MLSLPLLQPQSDTLLHRTSFRPRSDSPPAHNGRQNNQQHQHRPQPQQSRRDEDQKKQNAARSPLALLAADEAAIAARKAAIRNFGAYWIRPPGVSKTLQAMTEEAAELAEQEQALRQEQGLRDMQAQQQLEEARLRAAEVGEEGEEGEAERDLDAEIPDAEDADAEDEEAAADVTFNSESMVEGSRLQVEQEQMEEAELTGAARDEADLGVEREELMERDLDDSVPEAGSYQHTDTEVEDSTSESELDDSFAAQSARRSTRSTTQHRPQTGMLSISTPSPAPALQGGLQERIRAQTGAAEGGGGDAGLARSPGSLNLSSSLLESSFVGSSPVMQRAGRGRGGGAGAARRRGRLS